MISLAFGPGNVVIMCGSFISEICMPTPSGLALLERVPQQRFWLLYLQTGVNRHQRHSGVGGRVTMRRLHMLHGNFYFFFQRTPPSFVSSMIIPESASCWRMASER